MPTLVSIAVVVATVFGTEWLVDGWLGEGRRYWIALSGIALMVLSGALVKASGINELTRLLRSAVIGAGIGAVLRRTGLGLPWLRSGLRMVGVQTEPETRPQAGLRWSAARNRLLRLGWGGSLIGVGMIWTGALAG